LVHSSLKKLILKIKTEFGVLLKPKLVYDSLLITLGEEGTIVLPLYNFGFPKAAHFSFNETESQMAANKRSAFWYKML